jgi:hypothetical protein
MGDPQTSARTGLSGLAVVAGLLEHNHLPPGRFHLALSSD